ncbi:hypothetical protein [Lysobacter capsici]|uniref:hypothetical protein n=1 Tax=Lysobacter capsici TaxID=435897 RepID=UPI001C00071A|nr:hypothetical protein [Lysobacter capsici]QWF17364.1 hypothetical protein KME82_00725 [Lysobacter capsici]
MNEAKRAARPRSWLLLLLLAAVCACDRPSGGQAAKSEPPARAPVADSNAGASAPPPDAGSNHDARGNKSRDRAAASLEQAHSDYLSALRVHLKTLADRGDPHSQLQLALLLPLSQPDSVSDQLLAARQRALDKAAAVSGQEGLVAWLQAMDCFEREDCDLQPALSRLQQVEPDNAMAWLLALEDAARSDADSAQLDRYLRLAAQADRYDDHLTDSGRETQKALEQVAMPPMTSQAEAALRKAAKLDGSTHQHDGHALIVAALATPMTFPPYRATFELCKPQAVRAESQRADDCRAVLTLMADGDSLLAQAMGTSRMVQFAADGRDDAYWRERLRESHWLRENFARFDSPAMLRAVRELGEVPAARAELERLGESRPPPGWLPESVNGRALITTGRLPPKP